jgi:hypothetical protein
MDRNTDKGFDPVERGWGRREVLTIGGVSVAVAAVVAACGKPNHGQIPQTGQPTATTALAKRSTTDVVLMRTGASLERSLGGAAQKAIDSGTLTPEASEIFKLLPGYHDQRAKFFDNLAKQAGGEPSTGPNPEFERNVIQPATAAIDQVNGGSQEWVGLQRVIEEVAVGTYQLFVPQLSQPSLRGSTMQVAGAGVREAAALAKLVPDAKVTPLPESAAEEGTTTTTIQTTTTAAGEQKAPVFQVPGAFNPVSAVPIAIGVLELSVDLLGPNSFVY